MQQWKLPAVGLDQDLIFLQYLEEQICHEPMDATECSPVRTLLWLQWELTRIHPTNEKSVTNKKFNSKQTGGPVPLKNCTMSGYDSVLSHSIHATFGSLSNFLINILHQPPAIWGLDVSHYLFNPSTVLGPELPIHSHKELKHFDAPYFERLLRNHKKLKQAKEMRFSSLR